MKINLDEVEYTLECLSEDLPIDGNCSAIDPETDAQNAAYIRDQLDRGNEWAWCTAHVVARYRDFEGHDYLGGCSYESEAQFRADGYFEDMKHQALEDLKRNVEAMRVKLKRLES